MCTLKKKKKELKLRHTSFSHQMMFVIQSVKGTLSYNKKWIYR